MSIRATTALVNKLATGDGLRDVLRNMRIYVFTGNQAADADDAPVGTNLVIYTLNGGVFTPATPAIADIVFSGASGSLDSVKIGGSDVDLLYGVPVPINSGDFGASADAVAAAINANPNTFGITAISDSVDTVTLSLPARNGAFGNGLTIATTETTTTVTADASFAGGVTCVNGLNFDYPAASGKISIPSGAVWKGTAINAGTAGWFRCVADGSSFDGDGADEVRFDGVLATSGGDMTIASLTMALGSVQTVISMDLTMPRAA